MTPTAPTRSAGACHAVAQPVDVWDDEPVHTSRVSGPVRSARPAADALPIVLGQSLLPGDEVVVPWV